MKIRLTSSYFNRESFNQYIITDGMNPDIVLDVSHNIGDVMFVSATELAKYAKPEHRHLADPQLSDGKVTDYAFTKGEYEIVRSGPFRFWNKLKSGELFK
ncbi:hypothetical protein SA32RD_62 [Escherichia phage vB_EcoS_SA32RD]|nr:hypothetical protein SA32RD_62 [Escherichia phage vB_EcoS_SA32RD]